MHHSMVESLCTNLRVITANFSGVQIFKSFMVNTQRIAEISVKSQNGVQDLCLLNLKYLKHVMRKPTFRVVKLGQI